MHELEEPLTSSHLILGKRILKLLDFEEDKDDRDFDDNPDTALRRLRYLSTVLKYTGDIGSLSCRSA